MLLKGLSSSVLALSILTVPALSEELKLWTLTHDAETARTAWKEIIKGFELKHLDVTVKHEMRGTDEHKAALRVSAASDKGPDIFFMWAGLGLGGEFVNAGLSKPLDDAYAKYGWDDRFISSSLGFTKQYAGGRHGVPFTFHGEALYYNKALFEKAGIEALPATYEDLKAVAKKLKDAGIPAITFGGTVNWHVMRLMDVILEAQCGPEKHDALKGMKADWASEACATASFADLADWSQNYILSPFMGIDQSQSFNLFNANRAAMMLEGDWLVDQIEEAGRVDDFGLFAFPTGYDRLYGFAENLYVSSRSEVPDTAAAFLNYFSSDEVQQKYYSSFSSSSVNQHVTYANQNVIDKKWSSIFGAYGETFVNGDQAFPLDVTTEYFRLINEVASGHLDAPEAAKAMQTFIDNRG
ncbi:ABC transporter substrate-binding protein [Cohaesibacter celericrescens]|uniref:ABC transporter substrate-binding protein n=1 Tax=Cohaesibacter celericrescens TaxID=2067669 RepID=A0A2N5XJW3_9HYPH|nr:extracellular solute-binding protein [Cohaesibacter celericrescens]PLW74813.1 ABC transporter substrate-binding protein [Cohaesibacter celericrescens]